MELKHRLARLKYPQPLIENAIIKSFETQRPNTHENGDVVYFAFNYNFCNVKFFNEKVKPFVAHINNTFYREQPITIQKCFKQPPNIIRFLNMLHSFSVQKCNRSRCKTCAIIIEKRDSIDINGKLIKFNCNMTCESRNVTYVLFCNTCNSIYVGETCQIFSMRVSLHRQHIINPRYSVLFVSKHIRECGSNFSVIPIFKTDNRSSYIFLQMEHYFIQYLQPSLNRSLL